jgi:small subunit ribosomal protein S27e
MAGSFLLVACLECDAEATVFGKAATTVACADCGATLATPAGGKAEIHGEVIETVAHRREDPNAEVRFQESAQ